MTSTASDLARTRRPGASLPLRTALAALAAAALIVAACGGDDDSGGDGAAGSPTGEPIKVMVLGQFDAPALGFAFPSNQAVVEAHFEAVNANGGINGRPVDVVACNDLGDANEAADCARTAVSEGVAAVVAGFTFYGTQILPILEEGDVAMVGGSMLTPEDGTSRVSFPMDGGVALAGVAAAQTVLDAGCTKAGIVAFDSPAAQLVADWTKKALQHSGATAIAANVPETGIASYASQVATIVDGGAECLLPFLSAGETAKLVNALRQSGEDMVVSADATVIFSELEALGDVTEGFIITSPLLLPTDTDEPGVQRMLDEVAAYAPDTEIDATSLPPYAGAVLLEQALRTVDGEYTAPVVLEALGSLTSVETGLTPAITTTREPDIPGFNRMFNTGLVTYLIENGELVRQHDFIDLSEVLVELSQ